MKRRLVDLIVCPRCGGRFALESHAEEAVPGWTPSRVACSTVCAWRETTVERGVSPSDCARCYQSDVVEGRLRCTACRADFPIINGIPRLLSPALLACMRSRYPDFFSRHPEFLDGASSPSDPLAETLDSFTRQRLDLRLPGPELRHQWQANLCRNLGRAATLADLRDKLILDVGCGFGRHLYAASRAGAETVGIDLSGGVDVARRNNLEHARCHLIQADVLEAPLQGGRFDVVWSFGVLHHMPSPRAAFRTIVRFARPTGGLVAIWVYGYRGMALTSRLSHMRSLHRLVRRMSSTARVRVSRPIAALVRVPGRRPAPQLAAESRAPRGQLASRARPPVTAKDTLGLTDRTHAGSLQGHPPHGRDAARDPDRGGARAPAGRRPHRGRDVSRAGDHRRRGLGGVCDGGRAPGQPRHGDRRDGVALPAECLSDPPAVARLPHGPEPARRRVRRLARGVRPEHARPLVLEGPAGRRLRRNRAPVPRRHHPRPGCLP